jgi:hypothetical protein
MTTHLYADNIECWREVRCIDVIEAAPANISREYCAEGDTRRGDEIRISRIRSEGAPHGMCTTRADEINAALLEFLKS